MTGRKPETASPTPDYRRTVELNRLDHELNRLGRQRQQAQVDLDTDTLNRIDRTMKNIRAAQGTQTAGDRADDTLNALTNKGASAIVRGAGYLTAIPTEINHLYDRSNRSGIITNTKDNIARYQEELARAQTEEERKRLESLIRSGEHTLRLNREALEESSQPSDTTKKLYEIADRYSETGDVFFARAKPDNPNEGFFNRLGNTVSGGVKEFLSKHMDTQGTLYQGSQKTRIDNYADMLALEQESADREYWGLEELLAKDGFTAELLEGMPQEGGLFSNNQREYLEEKGVSDPDDVLAAFRLWQSASQKADAYRQSIDAQQGAAEAARELADTVMQSGEEDIERAKDGLNGFGRFLVDAGILGGQAAGDAALGALTGSSANLPMVIRTFGEAAQEARRNGTNINQQLLDGFGSAGIAYLTGKLPNISNPFREIFGQGIADMLAGELVKKYGTTAATQMMQQVVQQALRDGGEALAADGFQFLLKMAIYGPDVQFDAVNTGSDFLAAAALGGFGKLAEPLGATANQAKEAAASFQDHLLDVIEPEVQKYLQEIRKHLGQK